MTARKPVPQMTGGEFAEQLRKLSREDLAIMVKLLRGWTPDGTEVALACAERVRQLVAEQRAARCPS